MSLENSKKENNIPLQKKLEFLHLTFFLFNFAN